jgi:hypothetical protein
VPGAHLLGRNRSGNSGRHFDLERRAACCLNKGRKFPFVILTHGMHAAFECLTGVTFAAVCKLRSAPQRSRKVAQ